MRSTRAFAIAVWPIVFVAIFSALYFELVLHHGMLIDDAYISLRYARNFADGNGFVYNPGEPVEGYTNFLQTAVMSIAFFVRVDPAIWIISFGIVTEVILILATMHLVRRFAGVLPAILCGFALAVDARLADFSTWGLETVLCPALYALAFLLLFQRRVIAAGLLFALAAMTRLEVVLFAGVGAMNIVANALFEGQSKRVAAKRLVPFGVAFSVVFGSYYVARWAYYGYPLPNTFYAKVGTVANSYERGIEYVSTSLQTMSIRTLAITSVCLGSAAIIAFFAKKSPRLRASHIEAITIGAAGALYFSYIVAVGGDHFHERFVYHAIPLLIVGIVVLCGAPWVHVLGESGRPLRIVSQVIAASFLVMGLGANRHGIEMKDVAGWASLGEFLRRTVPQRSTLAVDAAGAIPYYSGLYTIDMLGLNDVHIAHLPAETIGKGVAGHEKHDAAYVMSRKPDYIAIWSGGDGYGLTGQFGFKDTYALVGLLDMGRTDVSIDRVWILPKGTSYPAALLLPQAKGHEYTMALYARRKLEIVALGPNDLLSRVAGALGRDGKLLKVDRGHPPEHVLYGPYRKLTAGRWRGTIGVHAERVQPQAAQLCTFDVYDGDMTLFKRALYAREMAGTEPHPFGFEFVVASDRKQRPIEFRLYCEGEADIIVDSLTYAAQDSLWNDLEPVERDR